MCQIWEVVSCSPGKWIKAKLTFSWVLSACQALITEKIQEKTQGGALRRRVGISEKPRVPVRVGYKFLQLVMDLDGRSVQCRNLRRKR